MTEKKSTNKSVTKKKTYYEKKKFTDQDLKRFKKLEERFNEILQLEKKSKIEKTVSKALKNESNFKVPLNSRISNLSLF